MIPGSKSEHKTVEPVVEIPHKKLGQTFYNRASFDQTMKQTLSDPETFWSHVAEQNLLWRKPWQRVVEYDYHEAKIAWFLGGKINVSENCLDRHLAERGSQVAIIWEGDEPSESRSVTYKELHQIVCKFANVFKKHGIKKGDRVAIYMPMIAEAAAAMLACARIGAIHSVIFGGFSADSIIDRVNDSECKMIITANEGRRGGKSIPLKEIVDEALKSTPSVKSVLVATRTDKKTNMVAGRDFVLEDELRSASAECAAEPLDSEDPLFILYTSGSTGKPKGVLHTQAGYLLYVSETHRTVFDYRSGDIHFCTADIGWITGHSYVVYGPLCNGATTVMFESIPTYPTPARYWEMIDRHRVNIFYTAPTAIRALVKEGDSWTEQSSLCSLRILGTVGEPINRDSWLWYFNKIGKGVCPIVDTWWQTETGGVLMSPVPGVTLPKPGSACGPLFGVQPCLMDESGNEIEGNDKSGALCIKFPWPGQMRTVWGQHQRFKDTYFAQFPGKYFTGDGCYRDADGYYWITGRMDDVLKVSGHRIGSAEIETALVASGVVAEAAVVGFPHEIKGQGIFAFCILRNGIKESAEIESEVKLAVRNHYGPIGIPDKILFVPGLPKTRSGKIMRRILRKIAEGERANFGDTTTLADPSVVTAIVEKA